MKVVECKTAHFMRLKNTCLFGGLANILLGTKSFNFGGNEIVGYFILFSYSIIFLRFYFKLYSFNNPHKLTSLKNCPGFELVLVGSFLTIITLTPLMFPISL